MTDPAAAAKTVSRRGFLKAAAAGASVIVLAPGTPVAIAQTPKKGGTLRVGF